MADAPVFLQPDDGHIGQSVTTKTDEPVAVADTEEN